MNIIQMHRLWQQLVITYQKVKEFFQFEALCKYRFNTFSMISPSNPDPIKPTTYYSHTSHTHTHHTRSNFFKKTNVKEKDRKINFLMYFTMDKKMATKIFCIKIKRNILFYVFEIWLEFNGYLFNIILLITTNTKAKGIGSSITAFILYKIKNDFGLCRKNGDFVPFLDSKNGPLGDFFYIFITVYTYYGIFISIWVYTYVSVVHGYHVV